MLTRLRLVRLARGQKQVDTARAAHMQPARLARIEGGGIVPRPDELARLAVVFGVAEEDLTGEAPTLI